jgi:hypothetical protein
VSFHITVVESCSQDYYSTNHNKWSEKTLSIAQLGKVLSLMTTKEKRKEKKNLMTTLQGWRALSPLLALGSCPLAQEKTNLGGRRQHKKTKIKQP